MAEVPPQRAANELEPDPEHLLERLSEHLEQTIAFAEECRWRFPELRAEAEQLAADAMALFSKSVRSMRAHTSGDG